MSDSSYAAAVAHLADSTITPGELAMEAAGGDVGMRGETKGFPQTPRNEALEAFEVFVGHHDQQQRALYGQMVACIRELMRQHEPSQSQSARRRQASNKFSLATLNSLAVYITSHQQFLNSLVSDIASGKIGKSSRKVIMSKKEIGQKPAKRVRPATVDASTLTQPANVSAASEAVTGSNGSGGGGVGIGGGGAAIKIEQDEVDEGVQSPGTDLY